MEISSSNEIIEQEKLERKLERLAEMREILKKHPGIYEVTQAQMDEVELESTLEDEAIRSNTTTNLPPINIETLKQNIVEFQNTQSISHLGILYAFSNDVSPFQFKLIFRGLKFDDADDANLSLRIRPDNIVPLQFTSENHSLVSVDLLANKSQTKIYRDTFRPLYKNEKIIEEAYLKIEVLLENLEILKNEGADLFQVSFGFMFAKKQSEWNCLHLIFKGVNSVTNQVSEKMYSTFNHADKGFSGGRPVKPPFNQ